MTIKTPSVFESSTETVVEQKHDEDTLFSQDSSIHLGRRPNNHRFSVSMSLDRDSSYIAMRDKLANRSKRRRSYTISEDQILNQDIENQTNISTIEANIARDLAEAAVKTNKVFTVTGPYPSIRHALRKRGWIEKFIDPRAAMYGKSLAPIKPKNINLLTTNEEIFNMRGFNFSSKTSSNNRRYCSSDSSDDNDLDFEDDDDQCKIKPWEDDKGFYATLSRMLKYVAPSYIWTLRKAQVNVKYLRKDQAFNHFNSAPFTTKIGLHKSLQDLPWVKESTTKSFFPRCYVITDDEERKAFIDDFRLTACMGIIRLVKDFIPSDFQYGKFEEETDSKASSPNCEASQERMNMEDLYMPLDDFYQVHVSQFRLAKLPFQAISMEEVKSRKAPATVLIFAIVHVKHYLYVKNHFDIDNSKPVPVISPDQWKHFLTWSYKIFQENFQIENAAAYVFLCRLLHEEFAKVNEQESIDGCKNVWIVKPGAKSRGRGIECYNRLEHILKFNDTSLPVCANRLVAQKYIERPLLVYQTKFDIRQWFMITDWNPLTVWWYNTCYLRFCSHEFTLDRLDESVHLSNNSIQHKYKVNRLTNEIPNYNMWYQHQFIDYLRRNDQDELWFKKVLPGMKEAVINAMLCSQNNVETRKNCFEIFGADFMISAPDFQPWLIEINSSPCMAPSTEVTAELTPLVLEDAVKVTVDRKLDRNANTGNFEMIYRQNVMTVPSYLGIDLTVNGARIQKKPPVITFNKGEVKASDRRLKVQSIDEDVRRSQISEISEQVSTKSTFTQKRSSSTFHKLTNKDKDLNNNEQVRVKGAVSIPSNVSSKRTFAKATGSDGEKLSQNSSKFSEPRNHSLDSAVKKDPRILAKKLNNLYSMTKVELISVVPARKPDQDELQRKKVQQKKMNFDQKKSMEKWLYKRTELPKNFIPLPLPRVVMSPTKLYQMSRQENSETSRSFRSLRKY